MREQQSTKFGTFAAINVYELVVQIHYHVCVLTDVSRDRPNALSLLRVSLSIPPNPCWWHRLPFTVFLEEVMKSVMEQQGCGAFQMPEMCVPAAARPAITESEQHQADTSILEFVKHSLRAELSVTSSSFTGRDTHCR